MGRAIADTWPERLRIRFPGLAFIFRRASASDEEAPASTAASASAAATCPQAPPNGHKILVVDDNKVILKILSMKLGASGYQVITAEDGSGAVNAVRTQKPDLILLDINFPPDVAHGGGVPWDGFRIMDWVRRLDEAKNIPI